MATPPVERLILRVVGGEPSILYRRNNVQWTEDGDDLPHFSLKVLLNRKSIWAAGPTAPSSRAGSMDITAA